MSEFSGKTDTYETARVAQAMKMGRAALGCNQAEFAKIIGVSKPTIARIETLEMPPRFEIYARMVDILRQHDVFVDAVSGEGVQVAIGRQAVEAMIERLEDDANRRTDRQRGRKARDAAAKRGFEVDSGEGSSDEDGS